MVDRSIKWRQDPGVGERAPKKSPVEGRLCGSGTGESGRLRVEVDLPIEWTKEVDGLDVCTKLEECC